MCAQQLWIPSFLAAVFGLEGPPSNLIQFHVSLGWCTGGFWNINLIAKVVRQKLGNCEAGRSFPSHVKCWVWFGNPFPSSRPLMLLLRQFFASHHQVVQKWLNRSKNLGIDSYVFASQKVLHWSPSSSTTFVFQLLHPHQYHQPLLKCRYRLLHHAEFYFIPLSDIHHIRKVHVEVDFGGIRWWER